mgnify:FL=1
MELLQTIASFIIAIIILVTLHEFGHFYVARLCGVKVLRFSIGFGKPFWSMTDKHGTEFSLAPIPLGGYVKMLDEREGEIPTELLDQAFTQKGVWQRIAIVIAGPVANFLLAILLYWVIFLPGITALSPVIGSVESGGLAQRSGLEAGQEIVAVDGQATPTRREFVEGLIARLGETGDLLLTVKYSDSDLEYETVVGLDNWLKGSEAPDPIAGLGITLFQPEMNEIVVQKVVVGEPAASAGIVEGDKLLSVDGIDIKAWQPWSDYVRARAGQDIDFELLRDGGQLSLTVTPRAKTDAAGEVFGFVGIAPQPVSWPEGMLRHFEYGVFGALWKGVEITWSTSVSVLVSVKKLIVGEISTKNLSGPITIAKVAGDRAGHGLLSYIEFLAMISVFLGVFNLLPIPVLDGGHLLYYLIEVVKGSPVPERVQLVGYQLGMVLVLCLMALAFYNDIMRL